MKTKNASDYKSQIHDEKIRAEQIARDQNKTKQIQGLTDLVKPILSNILLAPLESKEKIRMVLTQLNALPNVSILNDKLTIDNEDYSLNKFIEDLLSDSNHYQSSNIHSLVKLMVRANIDKKLIPNPHIAHLMEKEEVGEKNEESELNESSALDKSEDEETDSESKDLPNSLSKKFAPNMNSTSVYNSINNTDEFASPLGPSTSGSNLERTTGAQSLLPKKLESLLGSDPNTPPPKTPASTNSSSQKHPASTNSEVQKHPASDSSFGFEVTNNSKAEKKKRQRERKKEKKEAEKEERRSSREVTRPVKYGKGLAGAKISRWVHF